jgi:hypothetical protein
MRQPEWECQRHEPSVPRAKASFGTRNLKAINDPEGLSHCPTLRDWDNGTEGLEGGWFCELPKAANPTEDAHLKNVSTFGTNEHLRAPITPEEASSHMPELPDSLDRRSGGNSQDSNSEKGLV